MKKLGIFLGVLIVILLGSGIYASKLYNEIKASTIPEIQEQTINDYSTNIANILINDGEFEVSDELITGILQEKVESDICVMVDQNDLIKVFLELDMDLFGMVDVTVELSLIDYQKEDEYIQLKMENVYLGSYQVPQSLLEEGTWLLIHDDLVTQNNVVLIAMESYHVDILGEEIALGIESLHIENGKLYATFFCQEDILGLFD